MTLCSTLQKGLNDYVDWGINSNMHLNVSKTKAMLLFPMLNYNLYSPLTTGGREIPYVHTFNYLGVILDDQLCFNSYYHAVRSRVEHKIFVLLKIRKYIDSVLNHLVLFNVLDVETTTPIYYS